MRGCLVVLFLLCVLSGSEVYAEDEAYRFFELTGVRAEKVQFIRENLELSAAEEPLFWDSYAVYLEDLYRIYDRKFLLVKKFGENYESMTDQKASEVYEESLVLQEEVIDLKRKHLRMFEDALGSSVKAVRFYQIDRYLDLVTDIRMINELPLINTPVAIETQKRAEDWNSLLAKNN